jgi:hypothetical protein
MTSRLSNGSGIIHAEVSGPALVGPGPGRACLPFARQAIRSSVPVTRWTESTCAAASCSTASTQTQEKSVTYGMTREGTAVFV